MDDLRINASRKLIVAIGTALIAAAAALLMPHVTPHFVAADAADCASAAPCGLPPSRVATQSAVREELAARYAPIVVLKDQAKPCDARGEAFAPIAVELVLDNPDVVLRTAPGDPGIVAPTARDLYEKTDEYYLDLPGNPARPGCGYERYFDRASVGVPNIAYAHIATEPGERGIALQYWFYYFFNDWNNGHEGDWEMIQIVFDADTIEEALGSAPDYVGYSQHSGGERADWDGDKLERDGDHPVVYVAAGSHSNQFSQKNYLGRAEEGAGFGCDDATGPGTRVALDVRLVPDTVGGPADAYAWLTYEGRWGERRRGEFSGPTGPNTKTQWTKPITWSETTLREHNVVVPGGRTAGINLTNAFCSVVSFASQQLLSVVDASPWLALALGVVAAAAVTATVRNTSFAIAGGQLRRRRRFGQILRTALQIYREHFWLMSSIALAFLPAAAVATALQSTLFRLSPLESLIAVAGTPRIVQAILGIVVGTAAFGFAYLVVTIGVIAAMREIEAGRHTSPIHAYRLAWGHAAALARARVRALVVTSLLALSIVLVPLAMKHAVDWVFIEQAILLDDAQAGHAGDASASAVHGAWWRTFAIQTTLLGIGSLTSLVLVTPVILLATDVPLDTVNVLSSLVYILVSPFVALAFTLLYFDVRARQP